MEWEFEIKVKFWRFAFLRKKDTFMIGENAKRWAIGYLREGRYWGVWLK